MSTLNDLDERLLMVEQALLKEGPKIVQLYAADYLAEAVNEIQTKGIEGAKYSTDPFYAGKSIYNNKSGFSPRGKEFKDQKKKDRGKKVDGSDRKTMYLPGGYEELRRLNGLQTAFVDLTFSGRMLANLGVRKETSDSGKIMAYLGASNEEEIDKLSGHAAKFKNLLRLSIEKLKPIQEDSVKRFFDLIKRTISQ